MSSGDVAAAIATVEDSRRTHIEWRDWLLKVEGCTGSGCSHGRDHDRDRKIAGDLDHHVRCIEEYDNVLVVLRAVTP